MLAIASGIPSRVLLQNAGRAAALVIIRRYSEFIKNGVEIFVGPGNNGGDGWVVAEEMSRRDIPVRVVEVADAKSADAIQARESSLEHGLRDFSGNPSLVVDALLGTGSNGPPAGKIAEGVRAINRARQNGSTIVALDIPTGLNATTGEASDPVIADRTISFGSLKRGHLIARGVCGAVDVVDIGLGAFGTPSHSDLTLASPDWVLAHIPQIAADAHKGTKKRLVVIAGDRGMAGAAILAGKAALRSGIGVLHLYVAAENRDSVHCGVPAALVTEYDELSRDGKDSLTEADAIVVGPGMEPKSVESILKMLHESGRPCVLDAGALGAFGTDMSALEDFCRDREVVLTPHPAEMSRLFGISTSEVLARRFEIGADLASQTGAIVMLKGTPTVIASPDGRRMVCATGTPALATGGSGDTLSGIVGTVIAQTGDGFNSAVAGAWVHGRAAELCGASRGVTLEDVLFAMPAAWNGIPPEQRHPVLASLPAVA